MFEVACADALQQHNNRNAQRATFERVERVLGTFRAADDFVDYL
jgi:hypothetical protein